MKRWLIRIALAVVVLVASLSGALIAVAAPLPEGETGPPAEALAERMHAAVGLDAWDRTGAVTWTFGGRNEHLWDRQRHLGRVRWGDTEVLLDLSTQRGRAWTDGEELEGRELDEALEKAWSSWCNDAFWLNPVAKTHDDGTSRSKVATERGEALLVTYASGGVTPGDSYLWHLDEAGRPTAWQMWVSIVPVKGMEVSWEAWITLETGALVSTLHEAGPMTLSLEGVRGAATLEDLVGGDDPFAPLFGGEAGSSQ